VNFRGKLLEVPSEKLTSRPDLSAAISRPFQAELLPCTDPDWVILRSNRDGATRALEFTTNEVITTAHGPLDVLGRYYIAQPNPGEVALYERGNGVVGAVKLE
jgi:hypothetical protein